MILLWLVLTFRVRAVKGVERNEVDIWSYCWNLCGKQEKDLQTTKKTRFKHRKRRGKIMVQQARMAGMRRLLLLLSFPPCATPLPGRVSASSISMLKEIEFSKPLMQRRV